MDSTVRVRSTPTNSHPSSKTITIRIRTELIQALDAIAQREERTRNNVVNRAIRAYLNSQRTVSV